MGWSAWVTTSPSRSGTGSANEYHKTDPTIPTDEPPQTSIHPHEAKGKCSSVSLPLWRSLRGWRRYKGDNLSAA